MVILNENLREVVEKISHMSSVSKAKHHEDRLKFHIETEVDNNQIQRSLNEFLEWVKTLLPADKYQTFLHLFKYPLFTNEVTEKIFNQLERVFEAKNPFFTYNFVNPELKVDWEQYRTEKLQERRVWRTKGWNAYQVSINSILVVDLPKEQTGDRPEPYFYWLDISRVLFYELRDDKENFEYLIFEHNKKNNEVAVFCDKYYRILKVEGQKIVKVLVESEHNLGFVPAKFFWTTPLKMKEPDVKRSDVSNQLTQLDKLLFKAISKDHLDLYASYPIFSAYESDCDYDMEVTVDGKLYHDVCDAGFIKRDGNYVLYGDGLLKCPRCEEKRLAGAGSFIEVPTPSEANNFQDLRDPISVAAIPRESLDYNVEELQRLEDKIIEAVIGVGGEPKNDQAKNEKQIIAGFESRTTVLQKIAWNFQNAHKFVNDTIAKLRYDTAYLGSNISWGKDFYIYTVNELRELYQLAKENGLSMTELDMIQKQIITTEYKNNPAEMQRVLILKDLEPYSHYTFDELLQLDDKGLITDQKDLQVKLNFTNFIDKFERENINVVEFGNLLSYDKKIETIKNVLRSYGKEREKATSGKVDVTNT